MVTNDCCGGSYEFSHVVYLWLIDFSLLVYCLPFGRYVSRQTTITIIIIIIIIINNVLI